MVRFPRLFCAVTKLINNLLKPNQGTRRQYDKIMRKAILFLFCIFQFSTSAFASSGKNLVVTKGQTVILDVASDIGVGTNYSWSYVSSQDGGKDHGSDLYWVTGDSDDAVASLSIVPILIQFPGTNAKYYKFQITPQKVGSYGFYQRFNVHANSTGYSDDFTYNITVVDVTNIVIPSTISISYGDSYTFSPTIVDSRASTILTWVSSNTSVATIDESGTVTTTGIGTSTITCMASNGVFAQCEVTVNPVQVSGITLNESEAEMVVGEKLSLTAAIAPDNATDKSMSWSSTNEAVAVVSESGQVTAVGSGTCQIKATANDGSGKTASCLVTVEKNNKLTVTDMTQCSGGQGMLNVLLSDEETIMGFQFDLEVPAGVTVAEKDNTHSISSSKVSDGLYRFVVTPQGSRAISQASGDGMTITVNVADEVATGNYMMTIKDIEMTVKKTGNVYEDIHPKNSTATLTVTEAVMGDVNGDGRVSVTDVISMNSYILEEEPAQFIRKVADLNGDGKVTITDMVQVIDIILGR